MPEVGQRFDPFQMLLSPTLSISNQDQSLDFQVRRRGRFKFYFETLSSPIKLLALIFMPVRFLASECYREVGL